MVPAVVTVNNQCSSWKNPHEIVYRLGLICFETEEKIDSREVGLSTFDVADKMLDKKT